MALTTYLLWIQAFDVTLDAGYKVTGAQGIYPKQILALIDSSDQHLGLQLYQSHFPRSPWMQESKSNIMEVWYVVIISTSKIFAYFISLFFLPKPLVSLFPGIFDIFLLSHLFSSTLSPAVPTL